MCYSGYLEEWVPEPLYKTAIRAVKRTLQARRPRATENSDLCFWFVEAIGGTRARADAILAVWTPLQCRASRASLPAVGRATSPNGFYHRLSRVARRRPLLLLPRRFSRLCSWHLAHRGREIQPTVLSCQF